MSSNTKITGSLMSSVRTLGEWVLRNPSRTQMALANARAGIGGARANQLLPALQNGLASFTQASGLDLPNFDRFKELDATSSTGSLPDELREVVQGALPVAYALAGADGTTFAALQQINDLLKIKPIETEMVPSEKLGSVGQSLRDVADDLRRIAKEEAQRGSSTGNGASNGHGTKSGVTSQGRSKPGFRGSHYFKAATIPFITTVHAEHGAPPYSVSIPTSLMTLTPIKHQPAAFELKAFLPTTGEIESSVVVKLTDSNDNSADVVFVVDFRGAQPPESPGVGQPSLVRQGDGVLDAAKGSTQALEFVAHDLPADWVAVVTTGATPPTHVPPPEALVPFAFRAEPEDGDPPDTLRVKLWIALSRLPSTDTPENLFVSIASKGKIVVTSQAQYIHVPQAPRALGFASLQVGASAPRQLDNAPQAVVPVNAPSAVLAANVAGVVKGAVARLERTGDATTLTYPVGKATSASPSMSLALGPDLLANAGAYKLTIENPQPQRDMARATFATSLTVVVGKPALSAPKCVALAAGGQANVVSFSGVNFLPESSTVAVTAYDADGQDVHMQTSAKITSTTEGEISVAPAAKKATRLVVKVTNKANSAEGKDVVGAEWSIQVNEASASPPRAGGAHSKEALASEVVTILNSVSNQNDVLEQVKARLKKAGYHGIDSKSFEHRLLKLRGMDSELQENQAKELLETLPHNAQSSESKP